MLVSAHLPYTKKNTKDSYDTNQVPISDSERLEQCQANSKSVRYALVEVYSLIIEAHQ